MWVGVLSLLLCATAVTSIAFGGLDKVGVREIKISSQEPSGDWHGCIYMVYVILLTAVHSCSQLYPVGVCVFCFALLVPWCASSWLVTVEGDTAVLLSSHDTRRGETDKRVCMYTELHERSYLTKYQALVRSGRLCFHSPRPPEYSTQKGVTVCKQLLWNSVHICIPVQYIAGGKIGTDHRQKVGVVVTSISSSNGTLSPERYMRSQWPND